MELKKSPSVHSVDVVTQGRCRVASSSKCWNRHATKKTPQNAGRESKEETELEFPKELAEALDKQAKKTNALLESLIAKEDAADKAAADLAEAERKAKEEAEASKAPSAAEVSEALIEAELTKTARARVLDAVAAGKPLAEAVKAEKDIAAEILESAGAAAGGGHFEDGSALKESERASKAVANIFG